MDDELYPMIDFLNEEDDEVLTNATVETIENTLPIPKEVAIDFTNGEPIVEGIDFKIVEYDEAIKVWIYHAIMTDRDKFIIYSHDYGNDMHRLMGKGYSQELTEAEAERFIKEALSVNPYILDILDINITFIDNTLHVTGYVDTIYNEGLEVDMYV